MPSSRKILQVIPEDEEPRTSSSSSSLVSLPRFDTKRTFSTSFIEVSLAHSHHEYDLLSFPSGSAPRPPPTPPKNVVHEMRSGAISPTPSTSSLSSCSPPTPTSSEDESLPFIIEPRHASIRPLNITKNNAQNRISHRISFLESEDSEDESDSEWYTQEFSKMIWPLPPPSLPKQQPSRPESLRLEPILTEDPITRLPSPSKRAISHVHNKRARSIPKEAPPPVPTIPIPDIPTQSPLSPPGTTPVLEIVEFPKSAGPVNQSRPRSLSFRRPPPRKSIPNDCDLITDENNKSFWSSDFDLPIYEQPSPVLNISRPSKRFSSHHLTVPQIPDSPESMYSQLSALPHHSFVDIEDSAEIEFAVDDIKFDFNTDMPLRLPLSLPNSPIDLEADFTLGLESLWSSKSALDEFAPPLIAITDADEKIEEQLEFATIAETDFSVRSYPLSSLPATPTSTDSYYESNFDSELDHDMPSLRSRWSSSTLASVQEERPTRPKLGAANKLKLYFGGGSGLTKSRQSQRQQEKQEKQHKRAGSASAIAAAKAAVARATTGPIHHHPPILPSPSRRSSFFIPSIPASPASPRTKKAQRQVVIVPPSSSSSSFFPQTPRTPASASSRYSHIPSSPYGKSKKGLEDQEGDVMVIGYGLGGLGKGKQRGSLTTTTVSDGENEEGALNPVSGGGGLKRKPIPVEMFLRSTTGSS